MSLIGKDVTFINKSDEEVSGIIVDKYNGTTNVYNDHIGKNGGIVRLKAISNVDYYLIISEEDNGTNTLTHLKCSDLRFKI